jgi:hypothetical protein
LRPQVPGTQLTVEAKQDFQSASLDSLYVVPFKVVSPLYCFLSKDVHPTHFSICCEHDKPVELLQYQAERAFQDVSEDVLLELQRDIKLPASDVLPGCDYEMQLALELMQHYCPTLTPEAAGEKLRKRCTVDCKEGDAQEDLKQYLDNECLEELAGPGERSSMRKHLTAMSSLTTRKDTQMPKVELLVSKKYAKYKPKAKAGKKTVVPKRLTDDRWWNSVAGDASMLATFGPSKGTFATDNDNGRFFVLYPDRERKSVSWTKRGMTEAARTALKLAWQYHTEATLELPPKEVADFIAAV